jgi:hypothetical protein
MTESRTVTRDGRVVRAGVEIVVIAIGILLALAAEAWWDGQNRQARELDLLVALSAEFEANAAELAATDRGHRTVLDQAIGLLERGHAGAASGSTVNDQMMYLVQNYRTDLNNGVLNGYLSMGDPTLITDQEVRSALEAWPATLNELSLQEERSMKLIDEQIAPFFVRGGDLSGTFRLSGALATSGKFDTGVDRLAPLKAVSDSANRNAPLLGNPEFLNLVAWKVRSERDILAKHARVVEAHRQLVALLNAAIEDRR